MPRRRPGPSARDRFQVIQLEPHTLKYVRTWVTVAYAARTIGGTREGLYQATRNGVVRYGYRWMLKPAYEAWIRNHNA